MAISPREALQKLIDRQEILDCLTRYCRGVDRFDEDLLMSAYHADATDDHGEFVGTSKEFWAWARKGHEAGQKATTHLIANHSCEIEGNVAHAETYCIFFGANHDESLYVIGNRYIDRLERRAGEWRIADRVCVVDWYGSLNDAQSVHPAFRAIISAQLNNAPTGRDRNDVSYMRPLTVSREATRSRNNKAMFTERVGPPK